MVFTETLSRKYDLNTSSLPKCRICQERHFIHSCPTFHNMSVMKRREEARTKGFCFNCLCTAHIREWCPSRKTCMVCQKGHHTMLHVDNNSKTRTAIKQRSPSPNSSPETRSAKPRQRRSDEHRKRSPKPTSKHSTSSKKLDRKNSVSERLSCRAKSHVFLPTALAKVLTAEGCDKVRLVLNSGSTQTTFSSKLVDRLQLPLTQRAGKQFATINLQSFHDHTIKIQITGEIKGHLNISPPEYTKEKRLQAIYNHLTDLADPHFFNPINIEIMLANDIIPKILKAGLIQTATNMPIAQSSVFGWIISGKCHY
ncbi:uncharacterized protein isoform X1 [Musca autumnalis]|uniref:uncharacterized protein isoform X1 n=1 Tax=Musca autumnalis TaxID=221902 RepID=UPI003CF99644